MICKNHCVALPTELFFKEILIKKIKQIRLKYMFVWYNPYFGNSAVGYANCEANHLHQNKNKKRVNNSERNPSFSGTAYCQWQCERGFAKSEELCDELRSQSHTPK